MKALFLCLIVLLSLGIVSAATLDAEVANPTGNELQFTGGNFSSKGSFTGERADVPLSFSTLGVGTNQCSSTGVTSTVYKVSAGGLEDGKQLIAGGKCAAPTYVRFYECDQNGFNCKDLFQHLWYKASANDLMAYTQFWTANKGDFYSAYECYSCNVQSSTFTYTCYNDEWRGEPGTPYFGSSGPCTYGCKEKGIDVKTTDTDLVKALLCADKKVVVPPSSETGGSENLQDDEGSPIVMPIIVPTDPATLSGKWSNIISPKTIKTGEKILVTAVFTANADGTYYLEAGIEEKPTLAVVSVQGSKCDNDQHWAGKYVTLQKDQAVTMEFTFDSRAPGFYGMVIGAYTGCLKDGGKSVNKEVSYINVLSAKDATLKKIPFGLPEILIGLGVIVALYIIIRRR